MSRLDGTIRFYSDEHDGDALATRLQLSTGVVRAERSPLHEVRDMYETAAFLPALPWLPLDASGVAALTTTQAPPEPHSWVTVIRLPRDARAAVERAGFGQTDTPQRAHAAAESGEGRAALAAVQGYARRHLTCEEGFTVLAFGVHAPGLPTTTRNPATGRHIGLHVDAWDGPPLSDPDHVRRNRFVANLGCDERYLLYVPTTLASLVLSLDGPQSPWNGRPVHIVRAYLEHKPDQPIVRVRIAPGEAYIAPTDEMIHDGSTVGQAKQDITVTYLGHFGPLPVRAPHEVLRPGSA